MRTFYLISAIVGLIIPGAFVVIFVSQNGLDLVLLIQQSFANAAASAFTSDVLLSSAIFWGFAWSESRKNAIGKLWLYIVLNIAIGLSFALPLFLHARQKKLDSVSG